VQTTGVLLVAIGKERFALGLRRVLRIERAIELTAVPHVPAFWVGIANVHGTLYPILDLGRYLGVAAQSDVGDRMLVLVRAASIDAGLLVDDVSDVTWLRADEIGPAPSAARGRRVVEGVTCDLVALLDLETLLSDPDLAVDDEAAS
jgi:chemotaxis signal transduction protein